MKIYLVIGWYENDDAWKNYCLEVFDNKEKAEKYLLNPIKEGKIGEIEAYYEDYEIQEMELK
jgi:hypothetical protein